MARRTIAVGAAALGVLVGAVSVSVARRDPAYSAAGSSIVRAFALLGAGWLLVAFGLASWLRGRWGACGLLAAAAGVTWFLVEWNNPGNGSSLGFTLGLVLCVACPALVAHALLAFPAGRLASTLDRAVVSAGYVVAVLLVGLIPALLTDPRAEGCSECPSNLVAVAEQATTAERIQRVALALGLAWSAVAAVLVAGRLVRASPARRRATWPVLAAGSAYLLLVAATFAAWRADGFLAETSLERRLWLGEAAALAATALALGWGTARVRRARSAVARLVVELAQSPPAAGLRDVLARAVGDPNLALAYPLEGSARLVDADGRQAVFDAGQERTSLVREGRPVAVLAHAAGALDDTDLVDEVTRAARLGLEHERLGAEVRARLAELRASRARIVAAGDAERQRLERDLHDGAQQRLVGLSLSLRLLRSRLAEETDPGTAARLDEAADELASATRELRELAHGIFPAVLADEGLAAAVEALAEEGRVPFSIRDVPEERFPAEVETAAYMVVAEAARTATGPVAVRAERVDSTLVVEVGTAAEPFDEIELEDRVGAVDGRLAVERGPDGCLTIRAELPCAS